MATLVMKSGNKIRNIEIINESPDVVIYVNNTGQEKAIARRFVARIDR